MSCSDAKTVLRAIRDVEPEGVVVNSGPDKPEPVYLLKVYQSISGSELG